MITRVQRTQHGFTGIRRAADELAERPANERLALAKTLFTSEVPQARMLATFLFGDMAAQSATCLRFMRTRISRDADWRVQEILAQAFDRYCKDTGYETALPVIRAWLTDATSNVRRAVTEGLRIWTARPFFRERPALAIELLAALCADESEYVRKSVGNALRDISRKHAAIVHAQVMTWDPTDTSVALTHKLASKFL
ncbi:MAG: DNA alkylation repair protein [Anaerolineales bacterium]